MNSKPRIRAIPAGPPLQALDRSVPPGPGKQAQDQSVPRQTSTASARSQCSSLDTKNKPRFRVFLRHRPQLPVLDGRDPNSKPRIRVFPAGPQLQVQDRSVPRQTRAASPGSKFPARPQLQALDRNVPSQALSTKNFRRYTRWNWRIIVGRYARKNVRIYARQAVRKAVMNICWKVCQSICQNG